MKTYQKILASSLLVLLVGCSNDKKKETTKNSEVETITIGSMGSDAEIWRFIAESDLAKDNKLDIKVKEIDGVAILNTATVDQQVDVNAFQSLGYLISFNRDTKNELVPIASTYLEPMGIYSDKFKSVQEIADGSQVALADNPANTVRGLRLLEAAGLIKLKADFDNGIGTPTDIIENPKKLVFTLIDDTTGPRILPDVDLVLIGNTIAFEGGLNVLKDAIFKEEIDTNTKTSINALVTTKERSQEPALKKLGDLYHSKEVEAYIAEHFGGTKVDVDQEIDTLWEEVQ